MATTTGRQLLQLAIPLVRSYGFTRETLARSVLSLPKPHAEPLSDTAVSALFGQGDNARRTLLNAWLEDARRRMREEASSESPHVRHVLRSRLAMNEAVLDHLPEAFALLATSSSVFPFDPTPILKHAAYVADDACWIVDPSAKEMSWYTRRASLSTVYLAAELHQFTSPKTVDSFLDYLLDNRDTAERAVHEVALYGEYIFKSWKGILKSSGRL
ncbi:hypothetical protein EDD16DRAFT_1690212 [Pisolithus croceorrhizus]|nr:hypothetical protein EV401DRAFT_2056136 [Pisolithus croceorrhizus]KAI6129027.1 hypothetical protein EDD16DRAFT_1690212 [Pisolithus croceorrhizus]KAI6168104.1 hypothetical protein EDD17DRAFT_1773149 [Pisolithus thermaeus]